MNYKNKYLKTKINMVADIYLILMNGMKFLILVNKIVE